MKNKKLIGVLAISMLALISFSSKAETTGTANTGALVGSGPFQIVIDPITKKISVIYGTGIITTGGTGSATTGNQATGTVANTTGSAINGTGIFTGNASPITGTEFQQALARMYMNGLTKYSVEKEYRPDDALTREEMSKIISQAYTTFGYEQTEKNENCSFLDSASFENSLSTYIESACKWGLLKGSKGKFFPKNNLTRPEAIAILIRMFEGKSSQENRSPRRGDYYLKAWALGLTNVNNQTAFEKTISRKEVALYLFRLKNIVTNESLRIMALNKISQLSETGTQLINSGILNNFETLANSISVSNDPELQEAISWMNDNGLTSYKTIAEYKPFTVLNREQAAKILNNFGTLFQFISTNNGALPQECIFKDIDSVDGSLMTYVENACQSNILKGNNGYFSPKNTINKAQFITAIIRMFEGEKLDETATPRWRNYFEKAESMGIVAPADLITFENPITRYEVALFLYRFKVKFQMLQNINTNKIQNQIITMVPGSATGLSTLPEGNAYIDMNLLENGNFDIGYIEVFGTRYKIVKSTTAKYFSDNFVRYGDVYGLDTNEKTGSINFVVSNGYVVDANIRTETKSYQISQIKETNAYYKIKQTK